MYAIRSYYGPDPLEHAIPVQQAVVEDTDHGLVPIVVLAVDPDGGHAERISLPRRRVTTLLSERQAGEFAPARIADP